MQYRVKQIGDKFYPQKKLLLFWRKIRVRTCSYNRYSSDINSCCDDKSPLCSISLDSANKQITNYINNYLRPFWCLGHHIKSYFCTNTNTYYYIDTTTAIFSDNSEQLCERVMCWEEQEADKRKKEKQKKLESKRVTIHKYVEN